MKYDPLELLLAALPDSTSSKRFSFAEIEAALRDKLPRSASAHREWWANQTDVADRSQARAWTNAGFEVSEVDQSAKWVVFRRR
jgi:hypothetical protein